MVAVEWSYVPSTQYSHTQMTKCQATLWFLFLKDTTNNIFIANDKFLPIFFSLKTRKKEIVLLYIQSFTEVNVDCGINSTIKYNVY